MKGFTVDKTKAVNAALFILDSLGFADYHKIFKILYFADQKHLKLYGRPVTGDTYMAMPYGPEPSFIYDVLKAAEKQWSPFQEAAELAESFSVKREGNVPIVSGNKSADLDELSESNKLVLEEAIDENKTLSFGLLVQKSHDEAWQNAERLQEPEISFLDMATVVKASDDMLNYIQLNAENNSDQLV